MIIISTEIVNALPANNAFIDDNFYKCVIDAYNKENDMTVAYEDFIDDIQLSTINTVICDGVNKDDNEKIVSLNGIEKLTNLKNLYVYSNNISTIDVSNNANLQVIIADENMIETLVVDDLVNLKRIVAGGNKISEISLKNNTNLQSLDLGYSKTRANCNERSCASDGSMHGNNLTTIDLSEAPNLRELHLENNKLISLDLSNLNELQTLGVSYNQLTELDVSNNLKLVSLQVGELYGDRFNRENNKLTNLDISNNTNLKFLYATDIPIESLDISNNIQLQTLSVVNTNISFLSLKEQPLLNNLIISGTKISELDLEKNTVLKKLYVNNTKIKNLNISKNPELVILNTDYCDIANLDISKNEKIYQLTSKNSGLRSLNTTNNSNLQELDLSNSQLMSINLSNSNINTYKSSIANQEIEVEMYHFEDKYVVLLKEYDKSLIVDNVELETSDDIEFNKESGIIILKKILPSIQYNYKTGSNQEEFKYMTVKLKLVESDKEYKPADTELVENNTPIQSTTVDKTTDNPQTGLLIPNWIISIILTITILYILVKRKKRLF